MEQKKYTNYGHIGNQTNEGNYEVHVPHNPNKVYVYFESPIPATSEQLVEWPVDRISPDIQHSLIFGLPVALNAETGILEHSPRFMEGQ